MDQTIPIVSKWRPTLQNLQPRRTVRGGREIDPCPLTKLKCAPGGRSIPMWSMRCSNSEPRWPTRIAMPKQANSLATPLKRIVPKGQGDTFPAWCAFACVAAIADRGDLNFDPASRAGRRSTETYLG
jgi:hypothetical protein